MHHPFPQISHIDTVLEAIEGRDEFTVADKGSYTIINYNVVMHDTFPDVPANMEWEDPLNKLAFGSYDPTAAIRRECRGIAFDNKTGKIIRRPLHKFFNINEREETRLENLDFSSNHWADVKMDGSMIAPMLVDGKILWATKMAAPDFHEIVSEFVRNSAIDYETYVMSRLLMGYTPIFEYTSRKKKIVLDYPEEALTLLAVRNMETGEYSDLSYTDGGIPVVSYHGIVDDPKKFMEYVHDLKDAEGFVIRWPGGYRVKVKAHEYLVIHRAKEAILQDRNIVELILDSQLDDIKAHLSKEEQENLTIFEDQISRFLYTLVGHIIIDIDYFKSSQYTGDRKDFAINHAPKFDDYVRPIMFTLFGLEREKIDISLVMYYVSNMVRNNLSKNVKYEALRDALIGKEVRYNV